MEAIVLVDKPIILAPDLTTCKTVGDFFTAIKDFNSDIFNDMETLLYIIHGSDGIQVPLNGPLYDPERPLPTTIDSVFRITARPMQLEYLVRVRLPLQNFTHPWPTYGSVTVWWGDTGRRLREKIHAKYGIPIDSFMLAFRGAGVFDTMSLCEQKILGCCIVTVRLSISIKCQFKKEDYSIRVWSDDTMKKLLEMVAKRMDESLECLRFAIIKCSGNVTEEAKKWLPDQSDIYSAEYVAGTLEENGFRHGDKIMVFRQQENSNKRKRDSEEAETKETA
ncbi:uncharacterized protein Z519_00534 [Cladophialophora bantiana CBS 173.52]|uniref:Ubiquitin-like domain-containing protein n=1 Tax=Cladophialophora bantiana (strain ATCC 10958 / CBS 173.52 / CDC B-1940 / NIH 8579) TaxID=1442370 RepID=A0A0D2F9X4_CLAB1|nr:uncharacterized protein Z519_00534 [Cladophialophora bantiana CBS 173.52]KIW98871.1 hypothetical protein Z519_00534 [Cladophialophora bantiana CBS 173.52]